MKLGVNADRGIAIQRGKLLHAGQIESVPLLLWCSTECWESLAGVATKIGSRLARKGLRRRIAGKTVRPDGLTKELLAMVKRGP